MSNVKRCTQCGILKDEELFRLYTYSRSKNTSGRYRICKSCEAINQAYKRAKQWLEENNNKPDVDAKVVAHNLVIVGKTEQLYKILENKGLRLPVTQEPKEEQPTQLEQLLNYYGDFTPAKAITPASIAMDTPDELREWLEADPQEWKENLISPEFLQETIYESLKAKYRPQTGVDRSTYLPIYDDTYKDILNQILKKFDDYEEDCVLEE